MSHERLKDGEVKVPRRINQEIKDLVHPIVLRRAMLWRIGLGVSVLIGVGLAAWLAFFRPSGEALLAAAVEAAGGMESWNAIDDGTFTRVHTQYDEQGEPISTETETFYFKKVGDFRLVIESETDLGHVVIGRDDEGYWAMQDGESVNPVAVARQLGMMCDSEYCTPDCAAGMAFYRFSLPFKLTDPGVMPAHLGRTELNGRPVSLLEARFDPEVGSDRWVFFVDDETKLIRKIEHYGGLDTDAPPAEIYWSDHKTEYGITFSHRNVYYRSNGKKLEEYVIQDVDFATPVSDEIFVRPARRTAVASASMPLR